MNCAGQNSSHWNKFVIETWQNKFFCKSIERTLKVLGYTLSYKELHLLIEELRLYHGPFWMYFWDVGESVQVLQMLEPHLRRQSSHDLTSPTDGRYFVFSLRSALSLIASLHVKQWLVLRDREWACQPVVADVVEDVQEIFLAQIICTKKCVWCVKAWMPMFI